MQNYIPSNAHPLLIYSVHCSVDISSVRVSRRQENNKMLYTQCKSERVKRAKDCECVYTKRYILHKRDISFFFLCWLFTPFKRWVVGIHSTICIHYNPYACEWRNGFYSSFIIFHTWRV